MGTRIIQKMFHVVHRVQHGFIAAGNDSGKTDVPVAVRQSQHDRTALSNHADVSFSQCRRNRSAESSDLIVQVDIADAVGAAKQNLVRFAKFSRADHGGHFCLC